MKDPALLWYFNDWHGGTSTMSRFLKGCYMDVLYAQFNNGKLSLEEIKTVLGSDFGPSWPTIQKKFVCEDGLYFNERLQNEHLKRSNYTSSRRKNAMQGHMENRNENRNRIINKTIYGEFKNVELFEEEYQKLVEKYGEKNTLILIAELDTYLAMQGKNKYANHYAALQSFARRKFTDHQKSLSTKKEKYIV